MPGSATFGKRVPRSLHACANIPLPMSFSVPWSLASCFTVPSTDRSQRGRTANPEVCSGPNISDCFPRPAQVDALSRIRQWRTISSMRFIETPVFTRAVVALLDDDAYRALQFDLLERPELGALIRNSVGLRKVRRPLPGRGKRGGLRVIYYWDKPSECFYMLYAFPKNAQEDLTAQQLRILRRVVREEFG